MSCDRFIERLDDLLEGRVADDDRRALDAHRASCPSCRSIWELATTEPAEPAADVPGALADAVLSRTTGSPCDAARARLPDLVDGMLAKSDAELVHVHLGGCDACRAVADTVAALANDLAALAETSVPAGLVEAVLMRTSERRSWSRRLAETARILAARPRIAWEGAYLGTVVVLLTVGLPDNLMASTARALDALNPRTAVTELEQPAAELAGEARDAWSRTSRRVGETAGPTFRALGRLLGHAAQRTGSTLGTLLPDEPSEESESGQRQDEGDARTEGDEP